MNSRFLAALLLGAASASAQDAWKAFDAGHFDWKASGPLIDVGPGRDAADPLVSIKDPTIVFSGGRWHVFAPCG